MFRAISKILFFEFLIVLKRYLYFLIATEFSPSIIDQSVFHVEWISIDLHSCNYFGISVFRTLGVNLLYGLLVRGTVY